MKATYRGFASNPHNSRYRVDNEIIFSPLDSSQSALFSDVGIMILQALNRAWSGGN